MIVDIESLIFSITTIVLAIGVLFVIWHTRLRNIKLIIVLSFMLMTHTMWESLPVYFYDLGYLVTAIYIVNREFKFDILQKKTDKCGKCYIKKNSKKG